MFHMYNDDDAALVREWRDVIDAEDVAPIKDFELRAGMARMLENTRQFLATEATPTTVTGNVAKYDPVVISMLRRMGPTLLGNQLVGVQPLTTGPTGLAFAIRPRYTNAAGQEIHKQAPVTPFSGRKSDGTAGHTFPQLPEDVNTNPFYVSPAPDNDPFNTGVFMSTADGEGDINAELSVTVDKVLVEAKTRSLKASYSYEMAQDLMAQHRISADGLFSGLLSENLAADINYETLRTLYNVAVLGCSDTTTPGVYDLNADTDGRWIGEKGRVLSMRIQQEAAEIMQATRLGHGNWAVVDSKTYNLLHNAGLISEYGPSNGMFTGDDAIIRSTNVAMGKLAGNITIYRDDYAKLPNGEGFVLVGWKGTNAFEAGVFYCPYVPVWRVNVHDQNSGQPRMFFKTRAGRVANPLADTNGALTRRSNPFYRIFKVTNIEF